MDQNHFLRHFDERPEGCHHRRRRCLLKGCERLFWPRYPQTRYCCEGCQKAAERWRRQKAGRAYRATENGQEHRQEQSRRRRQRQRERTPSASADEEPPREGQRPASPEENSATQRCARPGCYVYFAIPHEHTRQRFCSIACRLALRRVLDREARYQARHRRPRCERVKQRARPPDSS